jgi:MFS family permease
MRGEERTDGADRAAFVLLGAVQVVLIATITLIVVALPTMSRDLGLRASDLALISSAYGLAFGGLLLLGGRLADQFGRRAVFMAGVAVFGVSSVLAGLAPGRDTLLAARFAQGCGAALAAPAALALLVLVFPEPRRRARALSTWGCLASIGAAGGIVLSGLIVTWSSWRLSFVLPIVVAGAVLLTAPRLLPAGSGSATGGLDIPGALLVTAGLSAVSIGLITSTDDGLGGTAVRAEMAAGAALLAAFALVELRARTPLIPLAFLASAQRSVPFLAVLLTSAGTATVTFFLTLFFQQVRGLSAPWTSAAFIPYTAVQVIASFAAGPLVTRYGSRAVMVTGLLLAAGGLGLIGRLTQHTAYLGGQLVGLLVFPLGAGLTFAGATVAALHGVPDNRTGTAAALSNTAMEIGPTVGLAVAVSLAGARAAALRTTGAGAAGAAAGSYGFALTVAAVAFVVAAGLAAAGLGRHGRRGTGHERRQPGLPAGVTEPVSRRGA